MEVSLPAGKKKLLFKHHLRQGITVQLSIYQFRKIKLEKMKN